MKRYAALVAAALVALPAASPAQDVWTAFVTQKNGRDIARQGDLLYVATGGGVMVYDTRTDGISSILPDSGLASVDVKCVAVDRSGNKWFGHGDPELGVSVLSADGEWSLVSSFEGLNLGTGKKVNTIFSVGDSVWIGTESGATLFRSGSRDIVISQEKEGIISDNVLDIVSTPSGIWLATDQGLSRYDRGAVRNYTVASDTIPAPEVLCLAADSEDRIWAGTARGFFVIDDGEVTVPIGYEILASLRIKSIAFEDSSGVSVPWFATDDGPYRRNVRKVARDTGSEIIEPDQVTHAYADDQGNIWMTSDVRSLFRWVPSLDAWREIFEVRKIPENFVADVAIDRQGYVWCPLVGNIEGAEDSPGRRFAVYDRLAWNAVGAAVLPSPYALISSVAIDSLGNRWLGVRSATDQADGNLLKVRSTAGSVLTTGDFDFFHVDAPGIEPGVRAIFNVEVDRHNNKWLAITGNGFAALDSAENEWAGYSIEDGCFRFEREQNPVSAIDVSFGADDAVWCALERNFATKITYGTSLFDGVGDNCTAYNESSPIPSNGLYTVRVDPRGRVWFGTQGGLAMFDPSANEWKVYTVSSSGGGLKDNRVRAFAWDRRGTTWIGTFGGGLSALLPDDETWLEPWSVQDNQRRGSGLTSDNIMSIFVRNATAEAESDSIWIATWGGGVIRLVVDWTEVETPTTPGARPAVTAYPNPYREGEEAVDHVAFRNAPVGSTIEIYTLTGELVRTLSGPAAAEAPDPTWDLTNRENVFVASGVYLFLVREGGGVMDRGKIAYVR